MWTPVGAELVHDGEAVLRLARGVMMARWGDSEAPMEALHGGVGLLWSSQRCGEVRQALEKAWR